MFESVSLDRLTMFLAVAEHGGFSAAGRHLGRVQSAVSHAVASLETSLEVQLFAREGRQPRLTDAGRRLVGEARLVLAQARSFHQLATELRGGVEPLVDVVVDAMFPRDRLVAALARFHHEFPLVGVHVRRALLDDVVQPVLRGEADFGLCNLLEAASDVLVARPLTDVTLVPVCAPGHPAGEVPAPQPMSILRSSTQVVLAEREPVKPTEDQGVLSTRTWRVADLETKLDLLLAGVGWGSMPTHMIADHVAAGRLIRLQPEPWPDGHRILLHSVVRADRPLGPAGRGFVDALQAVVRETGPERATLRSRT